MSQEDYPILAAWKRRGLDRFPAIPLEMVVRKRAAALYQDCDRIAKHEDYFFFFLEDARQRGQVPLKLKENWLQHGEGNLKGEIVTQLCAYGLKHAHAEQDARLRGKPLKVAVPPGGGVLFSPNELAVLKLAYKELQACIKEVRRLVKSREKKDQQYPPSDIDLQASFPWLNDLFAEKELPRLFELSPSNCAYTILAKRLRVFLRYAISPRTLKDDLKKVSLA